MNLSVTLWLHLVGAALLVGGGIIFATVILPAARSLPEAQRATYIGKMARRLANVVWIALAVLLLTGLSQLNIRGLPLIAVFKPSLIGGHFGQIFTAKMVLFWVLVFINVLEEIANPMLRRREWRLESSSADYRPGMLAQMLRTRALVNAIMGAVSLVLALVIVYLGVQLTR